MAEYAWGIFRSICLNNIFLKISQDRTRTSFYLFTFKLTIDMDRGYSLEPHQRGANGSEICVRFNAPDICIPGSLEAGDSGDIAGPKCRDLTFDYSRQCRRCAGVLISHQNTNLCHILTTRGKLSLYICTVRSALVSLPRLLSIPVGILNMVATPGLPNKWLCVCIDIDLSIWNNSQLLCFVNKNVGTCTYIKGRRLLSESMYVPVHM